ncbi:MAG: isoquinoline 1-oxidoreductase beta subunit [Bradyrhizobium sp.]|jgi:isoquinoline 1-oxidoreductase beta subunit
MPNIPPKKKSRRYFLLAALGVTGALTVGWGLMPPRQRQEGSKPLPVVDGEVALNGWIKIGRDGIVTVAMHRSEMGQGVHTALPMLVAEELDVPLSMVRIMQAPIDKIYGNVTMLADGLPFHPDDNGLIKRSAQWLTAKVARELGLMVTGGSSSVKDAWGPMREAGATARAMLVAAAAQQWKVPDAECRTDAGVVSHPDGRRASYGELVEAAVHSKPGTISLRQPAQFKLIGTPQPRRDSAVKVDGSAIFGLDVRVPAMVYAAVRMSPTLGGSVGQFVEGAVRAMPGVLQVVDFSAAAGGVAGVAVIAKSFWQAQLAVKALPLEWVAGPNAALKTDDVFADLVAKLDSEPGYVYYSAGDMALAGNAVKTLQVEYRAPFLAHAALEPINCTAQVRDGKVTLWASTQVPSVALAAAARVAGVDKEQVKVHVTYLGGGFGRRLEIDMVAQAVAIAMSAAGAPVQVIWSREEDTTHDMYRPAALARFSAAFDGAGQVIGFDCKSASGSITQQVLKRTFGLPSGGPDKTTVEGEFDLPYAFPNQRIAHVIAPTPVPLGYWRSVGHSHNAFFTESFIDEIALAVGKDEVDFRRELLKNHPRHLAVLDAALAKAGPAPAGHAHGVALHQSFGSIVAEVADVSIKARTIHVHRVVCAVDCGIAVNPNLIAQQMESAVIFGLSAALFGEITLENGQVQEDNFSNYPVVRMHQAPLVETIIIASNEPPEGIGEPGVPPIAPAVANAIFKLTGTRLRTLPLRLS